jgi:hypothetical protein
VLDHLFGAAPATSENSGTVWSVSDDGLASSPTMRLNLPDDVPFPDRFTMEHWQYLHWSGKVSQIPYRLAPFPPMVHDPGDLKDQLVAWNIVDPMTGQIAKDADRLFADLTRNYSHAVFGQVTFPARAHDRTFDFPAEAKDWGLSNKMHVVPQVPFLITVCENQRVTSAVSTAEALSVNTSECDARDVPGACISREILHILDPSGLWGPRKLPAVRIPRSAADLFAADPVLGRLDGSRDEHVFAAAVARVAKAAGVPRSTMAVLADLVKAPVVAQLSMAAARVTAAGEDLSMGSAVEVWLLGDEAGGMVARGPSRDQHGHLMVQYCPATSRDLEELIEGLFVETSADPSELSEDLRKAWRNHLTLG